MIRLWGRLSSINVRKVVFAAQLLDLRFERTDAGAAFGIVRTPDYLAKNPNAMVPLLEDDRVQLWESNVIVRYLCARYGGESWYPADLAQRFDAERWMDWQQTTLNPAGRDAFVQLFRTPDDQREPQRIADSVAATEPLLDILERHLAGRAFMAGDRLGMADVPIACELHRWLGLPLAHADRPHLRRWYASVLALPAARGALDVPLS
ncbi:MAG: glutathione S-transferase [Comamonadaceae bacterium]|nr:MAG: glutathione S-transferase [Comamonadaceae bacterium]